MSLVLAAAIIASFAVIGAGAAFTDQNEITYKTPVAVLSGAGVIDGYDTGAFGPKDTLTREQAAKLICYALLGKTLSDRLKSSSDPFKDVPANKWSAPFISYCAGEGIVAGDGTGKFNPTDKVTATQFAKMILSAIGYGKKGEFTGANWDNNTIIQAYTLGLFLGTGNVDFSAPATREEAALYLFNAISLKFQKYSKDTESYSDTTRSFAGNMGIMQTAAVDDFGRTGFVWTKGGVPITDSISNEEYAFTTTNGQWPVSALGSVMPAAGCTYYWNGYTVGSVALKPGDVAQFVVNASNQATKVVVNSKAFGYVTSAPAYTTDNKLSIAIGGTVYSNVAKYDIPSGLTVGSAVLYVQTASGKLFIEKANSVRGQLKSVSGDLKTIGFGSALYTVSGAFIGSLTAPVFNVDATLYTDANGYALDIQTGAPTSVNYAVLIAADQISTGLFGTTTNKARLLKSDGTLQDVTTSGDYRLWAKNVWYKVGADSVGVVLSEPDTLETGLVITGNKAAYALGHIGNANTKFFYNNGSTIVTYSGISALPSMTGASISAVASGGIDTLVYISAGTAAGSSTQYLAYLYSGVFTLMPDALTPGAYDYSYPAIVNDVNTTLVFDNEYTGGFGLKAITYTNGRVTSVTDPSPLPLTAIGTGAANAGVVMLGTGYYTYNANTKVFIIDGGNVTAGTYTSIGTDANDTVVFTLASPSDLLTSVYITKVS